MFITFGWYILFEKLFVKIESIIFIISLFWTHSGYNKDI